MTPTVYLCFTALIFQRQACFCVRWISICFTIKIIDSILKSQNVLFLLPDWESAQKGYTIAKAHPPPLPPLRPDCPLFLKSLFFLSFFLLHSAFKLFETVPTRPHATPFCPNPTHQPFLHIVHGFKQISKGQFYKFSCPFLSNPFTNKSRHLNL